MTAPELTELSPPPDAIEAGGKEILRVFVANGGLSLSLQRAFDDPAVWGRLFADIAHYVAGVYGRETGRDPQAVLEAIRAELRQGLEQSDFSLDS